MKVRSKNFKAYFIGPKLLPLLLIEIFNVKVFSRDKVNCNIDECVKLNTKNHKSKRSSRLFFKKM